MKRAIAVMIVAVLVCTCTVGVCGKETYEASGQLAGLTKEFVLAYMEIYKGNPGRFDDKQIELLYKYYKIYTMCKDALKIEKELAGGSTLDVENMVMAGWDNLDEIFDELYREWKEGEMDSERYAKEFVELLDIIMKTR